jgi:hypothetical protein
MKRGCARRHDLVPFLVDILAQFHHEYLMLQAQQPKENAWPSSGRNGNRLRGPQPFLAELTRLREKHGLSLWSA